MDSDVGAQVEIDDEVKYVDSSSAEQSADTSEDSETMTKTQRFTRWLTNNFTNNKHDDAMALRKRNKRGDQEHTYINHVILQMLRRVKDIKTEEQILQVKIFLPCPTLSFVCGVCQVFQGFDTNGDGVICKKEMRMVVESLLHMQLKDVEFRKFYAKVDTDNNGTVDYKEFVQWITGKAIV